MIGYFLRRLVQSLLILLGVSIITFVLLYWLPADPVEAQLTRSRRVRCPGLKRDAPQRRACVD